MSDGIRSGRRGPALTVLVGILLAILSGYTVAASWQQARLVRQVAATASDTDAYQQAAYLVSRELGLIQAAIQEPDGEERFQVRTVNELADIAMMRMARIDGVHDGDAARLARVHRDLVPRVVGFLAQLDRGDTEAAFTIVETQIEPHYMEMTASLLDEQNQHLQEYDRQQAAAQRESDRSVLAVAIVFLLGLIVLAGFGLSGRAHRRQVEAMAATDPLTGLPNRTAFTAHTEQALADSRPTVLVINVDGFRDVNDQLGQRVGDLLLIEIGHRLASSVRDEDVVARLGGDEFAVLLCGSESERGEIIAMRLTEAFMNAFVVGEITIDLEVSIGAADAETGDDAAGVLRHADAAMLSAKQRHTGYHKFGPEHRQDAATRLSLLGDLRRALEEPGQLTLHYQPKIALDTGALTGVEALARWTHPTRGPISPADFIPVLEVTSLMHRFTDQVLAMALHQTRAWLGAGHRVPIAVNISTRSLLDPAFPDRVAALLAEIGVPGDLLGIEVTEYALMTDPDAAIAALHRLRGLGVKVSIDDYGTGYSSMTYLKVLPVDELKIDQSFVRDIAGDSGSRALVASTVELGHSLGLTVVAEGVENAGAVDALRAIGCDIAQGYHYSAPVSAETLTDRLARQPVG